MRLTQINTKKNSIARQIRAIQDDYRDVEPEDIPDDVKADIAALRAELARLRALAESKVAKRSEFDDVEPKDEEINLDIDAVTEED